MFVCICQFSFCLQCNKTRDVSRHQN